MTLAESTKRVKVILEADARAYDQAMRQAEQSTSKFQRAADTAVRVGDRLTVGLSAPLALLGKSAVDAASDLSEAVNVTGLTFGEARAEIDAFARTAAERIGQSERAAREATATFGGLLQNLGLAQDETVAWSQDLTVLASDLASAFNTEPADAVQALGAALRGETEPIRRYNVMLSDQAIRQEAVEMGLAATTAEVGNAEKAQAALNLIMEQTSAVQGDFANTADGLANSQRVLAAQWEDTRAQLGENLLPIMERVVSALSDMVAAFGDLPPGAQSTVLALGGVAAAAGPILSIGGRLVRSWDDVSGAFRRTGDAAAGASRSMSLMGSVGAAAAVAGVGLLIQRLMDARAEADALADSIALDVGDNPAAQLAAFNDELERQADIRGSIAQRVGEGVSFWTADFWRDLINPISDTRAAMDELGDRTAELRGEVELAASEGQRFADHQAALNFYLNEGYSYADAFAAASMEMAQNVSAAATATDGWTQRTVAANDAADTLRGGLTGVTSSHDSWMGSLQSSAVRLDAASEKYRSMVDPLSAFGTALQRNEEEARTWAEAQAEQTDDASDSWEDYYTDVDTTLADVNQSLRDQTAEQQQWADDLQAVAMRVPAEFLPELDRIASESPELLAAMREASDEELVEFVTLSGIRGAEIVDGISAALSVMPAIAARFGQETADGFTSRLASGVLTSAQIMAAYNESLVSGINPLLIALGRNAISAANGNISVDGIARAVSRNAGGIIPGGGPDRDSVPAILTPGEFVMRRTAVNMYGADTMAAINAGRAEVRAYNTGGFVSPDDVPRPPGHQFSSFIGQPLSAVNDRMFDETKAWVSENAGFGRGLAWARSQAGKPYLWGGVGPGGYDCSGFLGAIANVILGRDPHSRLFTSASIIDSGGGGLFGGGPSSPFQIGAFKGNPGHVAGTLLGVNVESAGGAGVRVGPGARGADWGRFTHKFGMNALNAGGMVGELPWDIFSPDGPLFGRLRQQTFDVGGALMPGYTLAYNGTGGPEMVVGPNGSADVNIVGFSSSAAQDLARDMIPSGVPQAGADPLAAMIAAMSPDEVRALTEEIAANREMLRVETLTAEERLAEVTALMQEAVPYTDEWVDLLREAQQLEEQIARDAAQAADEIARQVREQQQAAEAAQRTADALGDDLIRLLDERDRLQEQAANATRQYATAVADAQARAAREINSLIGARNDALFGAFGALDQRFSAGWGNLTSQYADELDRRFELFDEWADGVQALRDRGLSEDVIAQLGLDDPSRIADVRLFVGATDAELQRLTEALSRNQQQTADTAQREADMLLGALGSAITTVRETLRTTLDGLSADLNVRLTEIGQEMAALGTEQGMSYADALTAALESGLPGVIALAEQYQAALRDAQQAAAAAAALQTNDRTGVGGSANAATHDIRTDTGAAPGRARPADSAASLALLFDSGGTWPSGTLGVNLSGRDEYVFTQDQLRSMRPAGQQAAPQVHVYLGNEEFTNHVKVVVDGRVQEHAYTSQLQGVRG